MTSERIAAFSDGVIAIIITIMVLELRVPHGTDLSSLSALLPVFLTYILSFIVVGIYWSNHHHLLSLTERITGGVLWANLHLLFWLSLMPFATGWMGENHFAPVPTALYGGVLFMCGVAYVLLQQCLIAVGGPPSVLKAAVGRDWKGRISPVLCIIAIVTACWMPAVAGAIYVVVTLIWL